jgi:hypothetical protein
MIPKPSGWHPHERNPTMKFTNPKLSPRRCPGQEWRSSTPSLNSHSDVGRVLVSSKGKADAGCYGRVGPLIHSEIANAQRKPPEISGEVDEARAEVRCAVAELVRNRQFGPTRQWISAVRERDWAEGPGRRCHRAGARSRPHARARKKGKWAESGVASPN